LEIGCGLGTDTINFARAGAEVTTVDVSEKSVELAKLRADVFGLRNIRFYVGNAEQLSKTIPVEKFDLIYSFGVIHHTPDPDRVFEELKKYCGPETELRIMLYSKWCWKNLWILITYGKGRFWKLNKMIPKYSEAQTGSPVTFVYSFSDAGKLLKGYEVVSIKKEHIFPYVIKKYVKYEYKFVWYFRWLPRPVFRWLEKRLGWHTLIIAKFI
jgi:ubiquinone/menaquinone biosynthesis C-methylase UbiE